MLAKIGEFCLSRKLRQAITQFDKRGTLPNAENLADDLCVFSLNDGGLRLRFSIERVNELHYLFSISVTKTGLVGITSVVYTDSTTVQSFSMYGAIETSLTELIENVDVIIGLK